MNVTADFFIDALCSLQRIHGPRFVAPLAALEEMRQSLAAAELAFLKLLPAARQEEQPTSPPPPAT